MKINGSLIFDASSASKIQNLRVEAAASLPSFTAADDGRLYYNSDSGTSGGLYVGVAGTTNAWVKLATGGNAAALQTEVDAIETSLGAGIDGTGTFVAGAFSGPISSPTSFTDAINQLAAYATGNDTLAELNDVDITGVTNGDFLQYQGGTWVDHTLVLADVTDVTVGASTLNLLTGLTATGTELSILDGVTGTTAADISSIAGYAAQGISASEFGSLDGITGNIQAQLDGLQLEDATLTALAGLDGTPGIVVQTGVDAFTKRTLVAPAAGFTITDPAGTAGNPTFALADDLAALEGLTGTGYIVRTGDGTATTRTITGTTDNIVVTNGSGVTSDTSIDLAPVAQASSGDFVKVTLDGFGRVIGNTAVVLADIETLAETTYVHTAGDVMDLNATLTFTGAGSKVVLPNLPVADTDAANKAYVDSVAAGLSWKQAVRAASTGNLTLASTTSVDGVTLVSGDRVLVKDQTAAAENGIYTFDGTGLVRSTDMDAAAEFAGATVFVTEGTANADSGWTQTAEVTTLGTDTVTWAQFSGSSTYTWGVGLVASGNTININVGAGITELPTDEVGIDLFDAANGALILTDNGTNRLTTSPSQLYLLVDPAGALAQTSAGLKINANSVTNDMLVNEFIQLNSDSASPSNVALGSTLEIIGSSTQGIVTSHTGGVLTITASDASDVQKGVATFDATEFDVTAGNVVLGTVPIAKLSSNTIGLIGTDASSDTITLGQSFTFASAVSGLVSAAVATDTVTLDVRLATTTATGVASFNDQHFSVSSGAVSLAATLDDLTNVSGADGASAGDVLRFVGGTWTAATTAALAGDIALDDLSDVDTGIVSAGEVLMRNGASWVAAKMYHLHEQGSAATTWSVNHAIGQKYCVVTVVDGSDEVVIPQSITFNDANNLTVTFNTAITGKVVVMGLNSASA